MAGSAGADGDGPLVRSVADTALWTAGLRFEESRRRDALFRDPLAERLAGDRGREMARRMAKSPWAFTVRTVLYDEAVRRLVGEGADLVLNLAAGMDTRPYRMELPPTLRWVEVDLPDLLAEKERLLADERPACAVERVPLDLADGAARRALLARLGAGSRRMLVLAEGLLVYLREAEVADLARDLEAVPCARHWVADLCTPRLLAIVSKGYEREFDGAAPMYFAPREGPAFFEPLGWRVAEVHSALPTAARLRRLPWFLRPLAWLPDSRGAKPDSVWGGTVLLERAAPAKEPSAERGGK